MHFVQAFDIHFFELTKFTTVKSMDTFESFLILCVINTIKIKQNGFHDNQRRFFKSLQQNIVLEIIY